MPYIASSVETSAIVGRYYLGCNRFRGARTGIDIGTGTGESGAYTLRTNSDFRLIAPKPSILQSMS
jgi:hypothetical protein